MDIINVAIIGYGLSGRVFHSTIIRSVEGFNITKVVTTDPVKESLAKKDIENVVVVQSMDDVIHDPDIHLIVISTPNTSHVKIAEMAIKNKKHVIVEKPFTVTSKEAEYLTKLAKNFDVVLSVYHNRRFDGDYKTILKIIDSGTLGRLVELESHFDRFRTELKAEAWREDNLPGSGVLYDLGSHLIDQVVHKFGMPNEIYADIAAQRFGKVDDQFELILYYDGLKVTLKSGSLVKEPLPRFILQGTKGAFVKFGLDVQEDDLKAGLLPSDDPFDDGWGSEPEAFWGKLNTIDECKRIETLKGDYRTYYRNIYGAIQFGEPLLVEPKDGLNVIKIIEAAIESNRQKKRIAV
ncbi:MAG: Gfo/Idh/MocA family oxidoreductase [Clostridiales bacterium]|nr:Gfo/Idh/MocA family oxidoreductase [Clostridiales bacterium]